MTLLIRQSGIYPRRAAQNAPQTKTPPDSVGSLYVCAYDIDNDRVLYDRRATTQFNYPASCVKVMTALLIAESKSAALDSQTVTWQVSDDLSASFSQVGFINGDIVTWRDLLNGILLVSGGDGCQAAARVIGNELAGNALTSTAGYARFTQEMNARAVQLGAVKTNFINAHGADEHVATARDMCVMFGEAFKNSILQDVCNNATYTINVTGANARAINLTQGNSIADDPGVLGTKTGSWVVTGVVTTYNLTTLWQSPSGARVAITTMAAADNATRTADTPAIIAALPTDFPYLNA